MKKILITVLIILLCIGVYFTIFNGISMGNFKILSVKQIQNENDKLSTEISQIETIREVNYPSKVEELNKETKTLMDAKTEYNDLASISTEGELKQANQEETYLIEFLWIRIQNHARTQGVNVKFDVVDGNTGISGVQNLNFTVTGHYIAITDFIAAIENDSKLGFRIENFKLVPGGDDLTATFVTKNVKIKIESTTTTTNTNTTNTTNNTNTTGTTNTATQNNTNTTGTNTQP